MIEKVCRLFLFLLIVSIAGIAVQAQNRSSISGVVYDSSNRPVADVYVELMNELYSTLGRYKTESSGRYYFNGLSGGNFKIKVTTLGTNYLEQTQDVQLVTAIRSMPGNLTFETPDNAYVDFHLKLDPRKVNIISGAAEAIFAQDVPEEARKLYKTGIDQLADKKESGFQTIDQALKIFPTYYDALNFVGTEYVQRQKYTQALPYLIKAIDVNQRSYSSFYALGYACYKLNQLTEAAEAFRAASIIYPQSINAHLFYGTVLRLSDKNEAAVKELLQAKNLSKEIPVADIHWQLGLAYNKLGKNKEAADELELYLKLQPKSLDKEKIKDLIAKLRNSQTSQ